MEENRSWMKAVMVCLVGSIIYQVADLVSHYLLNNRIEQLELQVNNLKMDAFNAAMKADMERK